MVCLVYDIILFSTVMFIVNMEVTCVVKPTPIHPPQRGDRHCTDGICFGKDGMDRFCYLDVISLRSDV